MKDIAGNGSAGDRAGFLLCSPPYFQNHFLNVCRICVFVTRTACVRECTSGVLPGVLLKEWRLNVCGGILPHGYLPIRV